MANLDGHNVRLQFLVVGQQRIILKPADKNTWLDSNDNDRDEGLPGCLCLLSAAGWPIQCPTASPSTTTIITSDTQLQQDRHTPRQ